MTPDSNATSTAGSTLQTVRRQSLTIFQISVVGLFLEMLLIRWIGTEIRIFAYLQNTVLVVCMLGLGMGCFTCRRSISARQVLLPLSGLIAILAFPWTRFAAASISSLLSVMRDLVIWDSAVTTNRFEAFGGVVLGLAMTFVFMVLLWEIFVPIGRLLGRTMDDHPHTIWAYSVNVAGSLVGIWLFAGLSALYLPPLAWFVAAALLALPLVWVESRRAMNVAWLAAVLVGAWIAGREPNAIESAWSPYQKLALSVQGQNREWPGEQLIAVNNTGYQAMIDLSKAGVVRNPQIKPDMRGYSQYDLPMLLNPSARDTLIVGAGSGNDVAGLLRGGAERVVAVEIDPAIIDYGRRFHPERPYASDRVVVVNDDARSYTATTNEKFDLIVFGLLDSHTTNSMTNARLDHFVYTRESLARARELLRPDGVMLLSFEAEKPYIAHRMNRCLQEVFGQEPLQFRVPSTASGWGGVVFVVGKPEIYAGAIAKNPRLAELIDAWQKQFPQTPPTESVAVTTDDWPYIYLESRKIPTLYYLLAALLVALLGYAKRRLKQNATVEPWGRTHWHFFFLGAAFMLLETQSLSRAAIVLGNTWSVNAVIISGILVMILVANWIAARVRVADMVVGGALVAACLGSYCVEIERFAFLPYAVKATIISLLCALPVGFSGVLFVRSFSRTAHKDSALGANLIGSLVGGILQSLTFVVGIDALLLIVAGLYVAALATRPTPTPAAIESAPPTASPMEVEAEEGELVAV